MQTLSIDISLEINLQIQGNISLSAVSVTFHFVIFYCASSLNVLPIATLSTPAPYLLPCFVCCLSITLIDCLSHWLAQQSWHWCSCSCGCCCCCCYCWRYSLGGVGCVVCGFGATTCMWLKIVCTVEKVKMARCSYRPAAPHPQNNSRQQQQ